MKNVVIATLLRLILAHFTGDLDGVDVILDQFAMYLASDLIIRTLEKDGVGKADEMQLKASRLNRKKERRKR